MNAEPQTPTEVAGIYVNAVRAGDLNALRSVFADDMEMVAYATENCPTGRMRGGDAIAEFYGKLLADRGGANPHLGPLLVVGDRIAVEIKVHPCRRDRRGGRFLHHQERQDHAASGLRWAEPTQVGAAHPLDQTRSWLKPTRQRQCPQS